MLRKDFTVSALDVVDARLMGADAVLLIVAALGAAELAEYLGLAARASGSTRWSRCTTRPSSTGPSAVGADLIGVNQRDLVTFEVDTARAVRLARPDAPRRRWRWPSRASRARATHAPCDDAGYHAVLVGESLVTAPDPAAAVGALRAA